MNQSPQTLERLELYRAVPSSKAQYRPLQGTMGAPPTPSSPVSAKRKSEEISREYSPSPDAKRVKVKSEADASGAIADLPEINHPTSSLPQLPPSNAHASLSSSSADNASVQVQRSAKFWYPDGNVVVRVDACLFKLHRSRLAQYCLYFAKLFEGAEENPSYYEQVDDFERLLAALDTPLDVLLYRRRLAFNRVRRCLGVMGHRDADTRQGSLAPRVV